MTKSPPGDIPKSLHTLSVLIQVARAVMQPFPMNTPELTLQRAMKVLGLAGRPDPHGLQAKALAQLSKEV